MAFDFCKIKYELEIDGFSVLSPDSTTIEITKVLTQKFNSKFINSQNKEYKVNIFREADLDKKENLGICQYNNYCQNIIPNIANNPFQLDAIFQTFDTSSSKHIAQDPHFDRIPTLKFMLYVNDLTYKTGAFCLSPGSHHWVKQILGTKRPSHGKKGYLELSRNIPQYIRDRIIPVEGKMGTVIIFNTDCIHHQGLVRNQNACIVRAHYRTSNHMGVKHSLRRLWRSF